MKDRDEYLSGVKKGEKFAPIITLVVYFGTEGSWDGAKCLYDLLEIDDELKVYVTNIRITEKCKVKEKYDMCKAFRDMRQEGYDEGIEKGIRVLIQTCIELGRSDDVIIEKCAEKYVHRNTIELYIYL